MVNEHISPLTTIVLGVVESMPRPAQVGHQAAFLPIWGHLPLWAWDGGQDWDLTRPENQEALRKHLQGADRVVVSHIPYAMADWSVRWWPVEVHERAITLGCPDAGRDLGAIALRYQTAVHGVQFRWSPSSWPFAEGETPPIRYLSDQARALQRTLTAIYDMQCRRTSPDLRRELATITIPCERIHARLGKIGIPWSHEQSKQMLQEATAEAIALRSALSQHGIEAPDNDEFLDAWIATRQLTELFPKGISNDRLREVAKRHPAFGPLRRYRRLTDMLGHHWIAGTLTGPDSRLHPQHRTLATPTGRTTTIGPALGSIPKEYRARVLTPIDQHLELDEVDFSGFEFYVAAAVSQDPGLLKCCATGKPVAAMAQYIFPDLALVPVMSIPDAHEEHYAIAKAVTYGTFYGRGADGLHKALGIDKNAAEDLLVRLRSNCPHLIRQSQVATQYAYRTGRLPIANDLNRHLQPHDYEESGRIERLAANTHIQGAAATVFRMVTVVGDHIIRRYGGEILLPLHDAFHYVAPREAMPHLVPELCHAMQEVFRRMFQTNLAPPVASAWNKRSRKALDAK